MTSSHLFKKALAALVIAVPFGLVACSSEESDAEAQSAAGTSATVSESTVAEDPENAPDEETTEESATASEGETPNETVSAAAGETAANTAAPAGGADQPAANADPFAGQAPPTVATQAPVEGQPANPQVQAEIENMLNAYYEQETLHDMISYFPENTCDAVIQANGGPEAFDLTGMPNASLNDLPGYAENQARIDSVHDVRVNGNEASAQVRVVANGETSESTMRYLHEDGAWKMCSDQVPAA